MEQPLHESPYEPDFPLSPDEWQQLYENTYYKTYQLAADGIREIYREGDAVAEYHPWGDIAKKLFDEALRSRRTPYEVAEEWEYDLLCPDEMAIANAADHFYQEYMYGRPGFRDYNAD